MEGMNCIHPLRILNLSEPFIIHMIITLLTSPDIRTNSILHKYIYTKSTGSLCYFCDRASQDSLNPPRVVAGAKSSPILRNTGAFDKSSVGIETAAFHPQTRHPCDQYSWYTPRQWSMSEHEYLWAWTHSLRYIIIYIWISVHIFIFQ